MKHLTLFLTLTLGFSNLVSAQIFMSKNNEVSFFSKTPMEDIQASNKIVSAVLNTQTLDVVVKMKMTQFEFPNKLMQEHFNENYMESDKFPEGTFIGKIQEAINFSKDGNFPVNIKGNFTIHGVAKERILTGNLIIKKDLVQFSSDFEVALVDHKIKIPKLVLMKIAEKIKVKTSFKLTPFVKK
ncbi:MAG: YceI family protein [Pseudarcicella sp.]|nr:YceI family protein [Pseudarcicella sp.]MBP6410936.1 YceI family protein [Pseudarcicella sp.]